MQPNSDQAIKVRKVTDVHANWSAQEKDAAGKFSIQLVLDSGAQEVVIRPDASDMKPLLKLLHDSSSAYFDVERGALVFNDVES